MSERERKMLAFLAGKLSDVILGIDISFNDIIQLNNIVDELGYYQLDEKEFRW